MNIEAASSKAIVFGITNSLYFALGTMLIGFLKHNPDYDGDFVVLHEGLSDEQINKLYEITKNIVFGQFTVDGVRQNLREVNIEDDDAENIIARYSHLYFAKFELPYLLDEYEQVIWLDVDMLVRANLSDMWDFKGFCWRPVETPPVKKYEKIAPLFGRPIMSMPYSTPNGGLIGIHRNAAVNEKVRTSRLYHWFAMIMRFPAGGRPISADELSYYRLAAEAGSEVTQLDTSYNCPSATGGAATAKIVHAIGGEKFWNNSALQLAYPDWGLWYRHWLEMGGEPYGGRVKSGHFFPETPNRVVYSARYQLLWVEFFEKLYSMLPAGVIPGLATHRNFWQILFQAFPQEDFHIEVTKKAKGFIVALHVEGDLAKDDLFTAKLEKIFQKTDEFRSVPKKYGRSWEREAEHKYVVNAIMSCANLITGSPDLATRTRLTPVK